MENCTAGLIVIGDEILRGQIVDTNTSHLARCLRSVGIQLRKVTVVPDIVDEIAQEVHEASKLYSTVFTSGGVGPTHDDVTYEAIAKGLNLKLELHEELVNLYTKLIPGEKEAKRLAIVPRPCELIYITSPETYAVIKVQNVYVLPGSPKYFKSAVDTIICQLKGSSPLHFEYIDVKLNELAIVGVLDEHVKCWHNKVNIGSYPQVDPEPFTRITLEGKREVVMKAKEEFLSSLPPEKIVISENQFTCKHVLDALEDSKTETHVKSALDILDKCYETYRPDEIFISFNGGKDCTVVLHLAAIVAKLRNASQLLCLYVDGSGDSFPEVEDFVQQAVKYYGLNLIRKERPVRSALISLLNERKNLKASLMGMRKDDPGAEKLEPFSVTDSGWPHLMRVNPILNWTYDQVWYFLRKHKIPYCSLYDQGYTSLGTKATTVPNPLLKDPKNPLSYLPAYTLVDNSAERQGRV